MTADEGDDAGLLPAWSSSRLAARVRFLLWDYPRGSVAYDIALLLVVLIVLLVPGAFWGDPFGR